MTEENLKRVGIFSEKVGTLPPFNKFRNGAPLNAHSQTREVIDIDSEDEVELNPPNTEGKARLMVYLICLRILNPHVNLHACITLSLLSFALPLYNSFPSFRRYVGSSKYLQQRDAGRAL